MSNFFWKNWSILDFWINFKENDGFPQLANKTDNQDPRDLLLQHPPKIDGYYYYSQLLEKPL